MPSAGIYIHIPFCNIKCIYCDFYSVVKYIPTQADVGDMALFLNKASIEVKIENEDYLIVPQSAILILIRDDINSLAD